jgi:cell wall-associated NlpC family hydrolase
MTEMDRLIDYAYSFLGTPYVYGGNNRLTGMDCSGFVCEILRSVGLVGNADDLSAQVLYDKLAPLGIKDPNTNDDRGRLWFFGASIYAVTHVAFQVDNYRIIESGGGDHTTTALEIAKTRGAMVRIRPTTYRKDWLYKLRPKYPWE